MLFSHMGHYRVLSRVHCAIQWVFISFFYSMYSSVCIRESNGTPLQYSCLENTMDGGTWWAAVHGVTKSQTRLSDFPFTFHLHALEKEMATQFSVLRLENPRDGGAWWAAVYGVTPSWTRLKRLSSKENLLCSTGNSTRCFVVT